MDFYQAAKWQYQYKSGDSSMTSIKTNGQLGIGNIYGKSSVR